MTDQEINICIAEACGWKIDEGSITSPSGTVRDFERNDWALFEMLPNYCHDLNAMHEAEGILTYEQLHAYVYELAGVHQQTKNRNDWDYVAFVHIPAKERAEAFLRTINKWKD